MMYSRLEYLDEPRELERMATPFGGGMHMGDHCGFYCAGLMVIGLACAGLPDGKTVCGQIQSAFTAEWKKSWPLARRDLRQAQKEGKIDGGCLGVGKAAGEKLSKLLDPCAKRRERARFQRKPAPQPGS